MNAVKDLGAFLEYYERCKRFRSFFGSIMLCCKRFSETCAPSLIFIVIYGDIPVPYVPVRVMRGRGMICHFSII